MYRTLELESEISSGQFETPRLDALMGKQLSELKRVKSYYEVNRFHINSSHIILKLAYDLVLDKVPAAEAYRYTKARLKEICLAHGIGNSQHYPDDVDGFSHKHAFLVETSESSYKNFGTPTLHWKSATPLRVVARTGISGIFQLPVDTVNNVDGFIVLGIDLPMFAYMLNGFQNENIAKPLSEQETILDFVSKYVIPQLLITQYDCILKNMMIEIADPELFTSFNSDAWKVNTPISVVNPSKKINRELEKLYDKRDSLNMTSKDFCDSIPTASGTLTDTMFFSPMQDTTFTLWFTALAGTSLARVFFLYSGTARNQSTLMSNVLRQDKLIRSTRTFSKFPVKDIGIVMDDGYTSVFEHILG